MRAAAATAPSPPATSERSGRTGSAREREANAGAGHPSLRPAGDVEVIPPGAAGMAVGEWWERLTRAAESSAALSRAVAELKPGRVEGSSFELRLFNPSREQFVRGRLTDIERLTAQITGGRASVTLRVEEEASGDAPARGGAGSGAAVDTSEAMKHPIVRRAVELFDARITHVERGTGDRSESGRA